MKAIKKGATIWKECSVYLLFFHHTFQLKLYNYLVCLTWISRKGGLLPVFK